MVNRTKILDHLGGPAVDSMMVIFGYHKHIGTWRRRGVVTMRGVGGVGLGRMAELVERERARRFFASAADEAAELARFKDLADAALDELVKLIGGSARAQEAN